MHTEDGGHEFRDGHVFPLDQREEWHDEPPTPDVKASLTTLVLVTLICLAAVAAAWFHVLCNS